MKTPINWLGAGISSLVLLTATAYAGEEKVALDKVPKAVIETVKARFGNAAMTESMLEEDDAGNPVYEVSLKVEGQNVDVLLTPEGKLRLIEKTITAKELPAAVSKTLEQKYPKAQYLRFEEVIEVEGQSEKLAFYEALLKTAENRTAEVQLSSDGRILKEE